MPIFGLWEKSKATALKIHPGLLPHPHVQKSQGPCAMKPNALREMHLAFHRQSNFSNQTKLYRNKLPLTGSGKRQWLWTKCYIFRISRNEPAIKALDAFAVR
jgi:hypothetical protein